MLPPPTQISLKKENKLMFGESIAHFCQFIDPETYTSRAPRGTTLEFEKKVKVNFSKSVYLSHRQWSQKTALTIEERCSFG